MKNLQAYAGLVSWASGALRLERMQAKTSGRVRESV